MIRIRFIVFILKNILPSIRFIKNKFPLKMNLLATTQYPPNLVNSLFLLPESGLDHYLPRKLHTQISLIENAINEAYESYQRYLQDSLVCFWILGQASRSQARVCLSRTDVESQMPLGTEV